MKIDRYTINIGSNIFQNTPCALGYQEGDKIIPFLQARIRENDGALQFSFDAFDDNGNKFHVRNNIPVGINNDKIEVIHEADKKIVKDKQTGKIYLDIRKLNGIEIYGDFFFNDVHIQSNENSLIINTNTISNNNFVNCGGILLSKNGMAFGFNGVIPEMKNI